MVVRRGCRRHSLSLLARRYFVAVFVPALPVMGFTFPFVDQLSLDVLLGDVLSWGATWVPFLVVCPLTVTGEDLDGLADAVDFGFLVLVVGRFDEDFGRLAEKVGV